MIFKDFMGRPENAQLKKACCDDPTRAKREFALKGDIQIPPEVEFRVYDTKDQARHNLAVLVLPTAHGRSSDEPADTLIAAWPVWENDEQEVAHLAARVAMLREQIAERERSRATPR